MHIRLSAKHLFLNRCHCNSLLHLLSSQIHFLELLAMNICVSNLDVILSNDDLMKLFKPFGEVQSAEIAMDGFTGQPRGFGFVRMPSEEQAKEAIAGLNKTELSGKIIRVNEAEPMHVRQGSYKVGSGPVNAYRFKKK